MLNSMPVVLLCQIYARAFDDFCELALVLFRCISNDTVLSMVGQGHLCTLLQKCQVKLYAKVETQTADSFSPRMISDHTGSRPPPNLCHDSSTPSMPNLCHYASTPSMPNLCHDSSTPSMRNLCHYASTGIDSA